jgi:hypothetical protein
MVNGYLFVLLCLAVRYKKAFPFEKTRPSNSFLLCAKRELIGRYSSFFNSPFLSHNAHNKKTFCNAKENGSSDKKDTTEKNSLVNKFYLLTLIFSSLRQPRSEPSQLIAYTREFFKAPA